MCRSKPVQREAAPVTGPTTRLNDEQNQAHYTPAQAHPWRRAHFPWWTLWLIWPLIGLVKAVAPAVIGALGALSQLTVPLLPVLLIAIGVAVLLVRRRGS